MKKLLPILLCLAAIPALAYDLIGIRLGGKEVEVKKAMPSAHCKALEWKSDAADRRCDDAKLSLGGAEARITVFLKADSIQAFSLSFDVKELDRVKAHLRGQWGAPLAEVTETIARKDKPDRKVFRMRWEQGAEYAVIVGQLEKKRATLDIARGGFAEDIYRIR